MVFIQNKAWLILFPITVPFSGILPQAGSTLEQLQKHALLKAPAVIGCELRLKQEQELQQSQWRAYYPLELGGSIESGQYQENSPLSLTTQQLPERRRDSLKGWDLEVSQRIDLTGGRTKSQELLRARIRFLEKDCQRVRQETRILVAEKIYSIQLLRDLAGDLRLVIGRLERIRASLSGSYRDPAMGNYAIHTIGANLREHREDLNNIELEILGKQNELSLLLGGESFSLPPEARATQMLPEATPDRPALSLERIALESQVRIQEGYLQAATLSEPMTLFASGGQKEVGPAGNALRTYEKENYLRAGLRLPVFSGGPELRAQRGARQNQVRENLAQENQEKQALMHFELLKKDYNQLRAQVLILVPLRKQAPVQINLLERALLLGRISYGDFWNGHELWHKQEVHYVRLAMEALQKLREIQLMAGGSHD
ncbi:MAG: TolC family protein [Spirochaetales bacterium]|nr:TolC family protein [Spirochaetales bacterium]